MFLSDSDIKKAIKKGDIVIDDFDEKRLQPASYDILLGNDFILTESHSTDRIDPVKGILPKTREVHIPDEEKFTLHPHRTILGKSYDHFGSDKYLIQLSGKSSLARIGLIVHNTAGLINPGHFLNITFELANLNTVPIVLRPKMPIAQLLFSPLSGAIDTDYKKTGRYAKDNWGSYKDPQNIKK